MATMEDGRGQLVPAPLRAREYADASDWPASKLRNRKASMHGVHPMMSVGRRCQIESASGDMSDWP